jgi:chromosomal replication initiator protein
MTDNKQLWDSVLVELELSVSKANFNTWFKDTRISRRDEGVVAIAVPNMFVKDWLTTKYHKTILKIMRGIDEHVRAVEFVVSRDDHRRHVVESTPVPQPAPELPLAEYLINKDDNLNPRYVFENFIVGPFNELAHTASQAVVKRPGIAYNPLFIYGSTGHGKTHLIQAIGNQIKASFPGKRVFYLTSERFTLDYLNAVQVGNERINQFKEKYRRFDVLLMDDIQFFSKKEKTQEELFHLFNTLYDSNKQIIFSSDKHPSLIPDIEERLKSRFAAGMAVDIPAPDLESRMAIIRAKAQSAGVVIQPEILDYLSSAIEGNIRDIEGIVNSITCHIQLKGREINLLEVKNLIKNNIKPKRMLSVKELIRIISNFYNIDEESIFQKTRRKEVVRPRQLIMYILREDFNISYPSIGEKLGGRDHTTVIHSCEKIKNDLKNDPLLSQELVQIRSMIA